MQWRYFFDQVVELHEMDQEAVTSYNAFLHACWFQWQVSQPFAPIDERWAFILTTNCPTDLVHSFTFQIDFEEQDGTIVVDSATDLGYVNGSGITNV